MSKQFFFIFFIKTFLMSLGVYFLSAQNKKSELEEIKVLYESQELQKAFQKIQPLALSNSEPLKLAFSLLKIDIYRELGMYQHAQLLLDDVEPKNKNLHFYDLQGRIYYEQYDFKKAKMYFEKALYEKRKQQKASFNIALSHAFLANCYAAERYSDIALQYADSVKHFLEIDSKNINIKYALLYLSVGFSHRIRVTPNDLLIAEQYYQKALKTAQQFSPKAEYLEVRIYHQLGNLYNDKAAMISAKLSQKITKTEKEKILKQIYDCHLLAEKYYNQGLILCDKWYGSKHPKKAILYFGLCAAYGKVMSDEQAVRKVLYTIQRGLQHVLLDYKESDIYDIPKLENVLHYPYLSYLMQFKADIFRVLYKFTNNPEDQKMAYQSYRQCTQILEQLQNLYTESHLHLTMLNHYNNDAFVKVVEIGLDLYKKTNNNKFLDEAFAASERSKYGTILYKKAVERRNSFFAKNPQELSYILKNEQNKQLFIEKIGLGFYDSQQYVFFKKQLTMSIKTAQKLKVGLKNEVWELARQTATLKQIQQQLHPQTVLVSYVDDLSQCFVFVISKKDIHYKQLPKKDHWLTFRQRMDSLPIVLYQNQPKLFKQHAHALYQQIFEPIVPLIQPYKKVLIVPDSYLNQIPFEALVNQLPNSNQFQEMPYLFHQWQFSYAFSCTLWWQFSQKEDTKNINTHIFSPKYKESYSWASLPFHQQLSQTIFNKYGASLWTDKASSQNLLHQVQGNILHINAHTYIDKLFPEKSFLLLNDSLYSYQIAEEQFKYDLLLLNACETNSGKIQTGEGHWSFSRAFMLAGIPNIVATLWQVDDQATAQITKLFYEYLAMGKPSDEALYLAKRDFLSNSPHSDIANPFYWAGLVHIGEGNSINIHSSYPNKWLVGIGIFISLVVTIVIAKRLAIKH